MTAAEKDFYYMSLAIGQARKAALMDEVPVGAVLVRDDEIIASGHNLRESRQNSLMHAEIAVIGEGCARLGSWRLTGCTLYVTLEPCPMCCGAIINSRIDRVVFGAYDPKAGCCGSMMDIFVYPFNHIPRVTGGVCRDECAQLLSDFFRNKR